MIQFSSKYRSKQTEIMDNFTLKGDEMKMLLTDLKNVNKWLGGNHITINGIQKLLPKLSKDRRITILDIGCGDGELLRECARFADREQYDFQLIGLDANGFIMEEARKRSKNYQNISFIQMDVFSEEIEALDFDIALCTLFLHHFTEPDIKLILGKLISKSKLGVVVNDLQRSRLAFWLFKIVSNVFLKTKIARYDGLVSVARGFKRKELEVLSKAIKKSTSYINWKWAFRYQWIIKKNNS